MKTIYKKLLFVLGLIVVIGCMQYKYAITYIQSHYQSNTKQEEYIVQVKTQTDILKLPLEEYLVGVIAGEMPANFELEALKAQVVAARTFVLSRGLSVDNTTASQVYLTPTQMQDKWKSQYQEYKEKIEKAIKETSYEVMTYQGRYISALFFSSSNGQTVNCNEYFEGGKEYLKAVDSHWDLTIDPSHTRVKTFTKKEIGNAFQVSSPNISITSYTSSGYVKNVVINQKTYTGRQVREKLGLASSCFHIELTSSGYTFTTKGSGHGVGMSQYGAQGMAKENKTYQDILHHYYKNIKIERID